MSESVQSNSQIENANEMESVENEIKDSRNKNEVWTHIIKQNNIDLTKNVSYITAKQITKCRDSYKGTKKSQFESRLLCKFDSSQKIPKIFKDNNISVISVKNGTYALIKENIYIDLKTYPIEPKTFIKKIDSLILDIGDSETSMLDKLYYNKVLSEIIGEEIKYGPLLGGRHRCHFETIIGQTPLKIDGSQYETDGCYETENYVAVVEAKSINCKNFNIRQLYYPFREVHKKVLDKKQIITLFIYKDKKKIIHIHKFKWNDPRKMLDITQIGYYKYVEEI